MLVSKEFIKTILEKMLSTQIIVKQLMFNKTDAVSACLVFHLLMNRMARKTFISVVMVPWHIFKGDSCSLINSSIGKDLEYRGISVFWLTR